MEIAESLKIIILGVIQGIAEFLPISSSGHLAVLSRLFDIKEDTVIVVVVLHAGTLVAIVIYYFKELLSLLKPEKRKIILLLLVGTVPTGIVGVLFEHSGLATLAFKTIGVTGVCFLVTGFLLLYSERKREEEEPEKLATLPVVKAFIVGCLQGIAILPGISRSGSTISAGMRLGLEKEDAATFSFLLAIPAIGGATFYKLLTSVLRNGKAIELNQELPGLLIGFVVSAIVGYFSLWILLKVVKKGQLHCFAYYCFVLGLAVIIWQVALLF